MKLFKKSEIKKQQLQYLAGGSIVQKTLHYTNMWINGNYIEDIDIDTAGQLS